MKTVRRLMVSTLVAMTASVTAASAEVTQIRAAQQFGTSYLTLMLMEDGKLVEKHAKAAGKLFVKGFQHKNALRQNNWQHNKHQVTAVQASSTRGRISHRFSADSFPTRVSKLVVR